MVVRGMLLDGVNTVSSNNQFKELDLSKHQNSEVKVESSNEELQWNRSVEKFVDLLAKLIAREHLRSVEQSSNEKKPEKTSKSP